MRSWAKHCALLAAVLASLLSIIVTQNLVVCDAALAPTSGAPGWETWSVLPGLGPFTLAAEHEPCVGHHVQCGLSETELRDPQLCPRCGVSLDAWYGPRGIYGTERDIEVRERAGAYAVVARESTAKPPQLVAAFTRKTGLARPALAARTTEAFFLALALLVLAVGAFVARRARRRMHAFEDRTRFRPATVEGGRVVLDDDAEPYALADITVAPGRVLVHERPRATTDYRTTRTLAAADLVRIDPAIVRALAEGMASDARRLAFVLAVVLSTAAGVEAAGTWLHDSHVLDLD